MLTLRQDTTISDVLFVFIWYIIVVYVYIPDYATVYIMCVKRFLGFAKYDSVTAMFTSLGMSNAQDRVQSLTASFTSQVWRCYVIVFDSLSLTLGLIYD